MYYNRWTCVKGPVFATIATLIDWGWKPSSPTCWLDPSGALNDFMFEEGISQYKVLHAFGNQVEAELWEHAVLAWNGAGL